MAAATFPPLDLLKLWQITKAKLQSILSGSNPPAFMLYTGDLPGHYDVLTPDCANGLLAPSQVPAHNDDIQTVLSDLAALVGPKKIPLLYLPGNNDSLAGDYFSFADNAGQTPLSLCTSPRGGCRDEEVLHRDEWPAALRSSGWD